MTLIIDLKRALREPEYRAELSEELEGGVTEMVMEESADRIDALEKALQRVEWEGDEHSQQIARAALGEGD